MISVLSKDSWIACTGPANTMILADTVGFHRGGKPTERQPPPDHLYLHFGHAVRETRAADNGTSRLDHASYPKLRPVGLK